MIWYHIISYHIYRRNVRHFSSILQEQTPYIPGNTQQAQNKTVMRQEEKSLTRLHIILVYQQQISQYERVSMVYAATAVRQHNKVMQHQRPADRLQTTVGPKPTSTRLKGCMIRLFYLSTFLNSRYLGWMVWQGYICICIMVIFSSVFELISSYEHFQPKSLKYVDTGSPSGTCGRGLSSIRALQLAWRAPKVFFFSGSG